MKQGVLRGYVVSFAVLAAGVVLVGGGCELREQASVDVMEKKPDAGAAMEKSEPVMEKKDGEAVNDGAVMEKKDGEAIKKDGAVVLDIGVGAAVNMPKDVASGKATGKVMVAKKGSYEAYDASKLALAENGKVVIFFHAAWCPTCKAAHSDITANAEKIADGVTILKVDYDTATELKKKYGVTYQHTFVQVDANGTLLKKWSGSNTLAEISAQLQ